MAGPAFCQILFWSNGGRFTPNGLPIWEDQVRGLCYRAYDCGECSYLNEWVKILVSQGHEVGYWCDQCLKDTHRKLNRRPYGFYQEGRAPDLPEDHEDYSADKPKLDGCTRILPDGTRCGWQSSFLQLTVIFRSEG